MQYQKCKDYYGYLLDCKLFMGKDPFLSICLHTTYWLLLILLLWTRTVPIALTHPLLYCIILIMIGDKFLIPFKVSPSICVLNSISINFSQGYCFCNYFFFPPAAGSIFLFLLDYSNWHATLLNMIFLKQNHHVTPHSSWSLPQFSIHFHAKLPWKSSLFLLFFPFPNFPYSLWGCSPHKSNEKSLFKITNDHSQWSIHCPILLDF